MKLTKPPFKVLCESIDGTPRNFYPLKPLSDPDAYYDYGPDTIDTVMKNDGVLCFSVPLDWTTHLSLPRDKDGRPIVTFIIVPPDEMYIPDSPMQALQRLCYVFNQAMLRYDWREFEQFHTDYLRTLEGIHKDIEEHDNEVCGDVTTMKVCFNLSEKDIEKTPAPRLAAYSWITIELSSMVAVMPKELPANRTNVMVPPMSYDYSLLITSDEIPANLYYDLRIGKCYGQAGVSVRIE